MHSSRLIVSAVLMLSAAFALAGCNGGSAGAPTPLRHLTTVSLSVTVPDRTSVKRRAPVAVHRRFRRAGIHSVARHLSYVSPDTQSAKFSAFDASGTVVASAYAACTATCASQLAVYPGTYTFRIDLFDGPNGTGNVLSTGTTTSTIGTSATSVSVPLGGGTVAYVDLTLEPATVSSGAPKTLALYVDAEDADGNFIVGSDPYTTPIQLTSTDPTKSPPPAGIS